MFDAQAAEGFRAFLKVRDDPFLPEAMGPKSQVTERVAEKKR